MTDFQVVSAIGAASGLALYSVLATFWIARLSEALNRANQQAQSWRARARLSGIMCRNLADRIEMLVAKRPVRGAGGKFVSRRPEAAE